MVLRPILLHGHERPLTQVCYNRTGDLLFTAAKDQVVNVYYSDNGERIGTYNGHNGAVWRVSVNFGSTGLITGSADNTAKIWQLSTGNCLHTITTNTGVRSVGYAEGDQQCFLVTDARMGFPCRILIYDLNKLQEDPINSVTVEGSRVTVAAWTPLNQFILTGHEDGSVCLYDPRTGSIEKKIQPHKDQINDIQFSNHQGFFTTASTDSTANIIDTCNLDIKKTFVSGRPLNSAAPRPDDDHLIVGGGQKAAEVTTTSGRSGNFKVTFYHIIYGDELGDVKGHFGPINTVAFHPLGKSFASGGEDGFVRLHLV